MFAETVVPWVAREMIGGGGEGVGRFFHCCQRQLWQENKGCDEKEELVHDRGRDGI